MCIKNLKLEWAFQPALLNKQTLNYALCCTMYNVHCMYTLYSILYFSFKTSI